MIKRKYIKWINKTLVNKKWSWFVVEERGKCNQSVLPSNTFKSLWIYAKLDICFPNLPSSLQAVDISSCGNFVVVAVSTGHIDTYNLQSGLHRGQYGKDKGQCLNNRMHVCKPVCCRYDLNAPPVCGILPLPMRALSQMQPFLLSFFQLTVVLSVVWLSTGSTSWPSVPELTSSWRSGSSRAKNFFTHRA